MSLAYKIARGEIINQRYQDHKAVQNILNQLHDYYDLSWPKIADLPEFNPPGAEPIPFSTLAKIGHTGKIPQKWRSRFRGIGAIDSRPRTMIHKENMQSTHNTLKKHVSPNNRAELIRLLAADEDLPLIVLILHKDLQADEPDQKIILDLR